MKEDKKSAAVAKSGPCPVLIGALVEILKVRNDLYNAAIEIARLDAAETILGHSASGEANQAAIDYLVSVGKGEIPNAGITGRVRALKILLNHGWTAGDATEAK